MGEKIRVYITPYGAEQCGGSFDYDESVSDIEIAGRFIWDLVAAGKIDAKRVFRLSCAIFPNSGQLKFLHFGKLKAKR